MKLTIKKVQPTHKFDPVEVEVRENESYTSPIHRWSRDEQGEWTYDYQDYYSTTHSGVTREEKILLEAILNDGDLFK